MHCVYSFFVTRLCPNHFPLSFSACLSLHSHLSIQHTDHVRMPPFSFRFAGNPLFSHLQPSSIQPSSVHPVIHPQTFTCPFSQSRIFLLQCPSTLIRSSPILLHVSHPSAFSLTPRNLSSSNSLFAQPFALLNYSGFIICFLFFTLQFLSAFFFSISQGGKK